MKGRDSATRQDVVLRFAIAKDSEYSHTVQAVQGDADVLVEGANQPAVNVSSAPDQPWCTCSEDAVPGTCTHVLYLLTLDDPVADIIRESLARDLELVADELSELRHRLQALEQTETALSAVEELTT